METQAFGIEWMQHETSSTIKSTGQLILDKEPPREDEIITNGGNGSGFLIDDHVHMPTLDQIAAENLIFMARENQMGADIIATEEQENGTVVVTAGDCTEINCQTVMQQVVELSGQDLGQENEHANGYTVEYTETTPQLVTEEVITDDWVQYQGEERVEIPAEQIIGSSSQVLLDIEVPLPTVQDEYTALRPYPCDFCSRRFRKKSSLMSHIVAHQNDRPHLCKLCGSRFFRRSELIDHLRAHAEVAEPEYDDTTSSLAVMNFTVQEQHSQRQINDHYYDQDWGLHVEPIIISTKSSRRIQSTSGDSSTTAVSAQPPRGRISRLKPRDALRSSLIQQNISSMEEDYGSCHPLEASTATVKLTQDNLPSSKKRFPVVDDNKPFVCQQCGLAFAREKAFLSHSKNHRNDSPLECPECNEMFWDTVELQEHQRIHKFEESNSEYDPNETEETQSDSESEQQNYGDFYCNECGMSFHRQDLLRRHSRVHVKLANEIEGDPNSAQHCCNTCGETFAEALDLLAHAEIHARFPPFKCTLCGESFFEELTIKRHLQSQHNSEMSANSCILCGKECRDHKALIKHAWDHSREKSHSCSKCGKKFHNKARLKRHMTSHRDKSVTCDVCNEEFPDGRTLSNHRHSHNAASTGKLFPCYECGKTFGSRSSQQIHVRIHTGERPYGCRFCWKAFADGGTLRKHERIHTGEKPYACSVCPRAFNQRVVLREHIRSHHSGLDTKRGTYYCTLCSTDLNSSNELIQHLIQHSDMNTAMHRQPVVGPRKYKRRRKLTPHELARLRSEAKQSSNGSDIDMSDFDIDNVDELLGISEDIGVKTSPKSKHTPTNTKRTKQCATGDLPYGSNLKSKSARIKVTEQLPQDPKKQHVNSISDSTDKLWQSHLANTNDDQYRTLLMNIETTLQSIDSLVVANNENSIEKTVRNNALRIEGSKVEMKPTVRSKNKNKITKSHPHPRMIHTEKLITATSGNGSKRRSNVLVARTETGSIKLNVGKAIPVDECDIMSPDATPPKQISSSPMLERQDHMETTRTNDLYDAHLLLEASTFRKEAYEKFNPSIVNDFEEILRSPIKCDKSGGRHRLISESSTQYLDQSEEDQHLIKIEPTSPDLREIVVSQDAPIENVSVARRSTRNRSFRLTTLQRKYLEFERDIATAATSSHHTQIEQTVNDRDQHKTNIRRTKKKTSTPANSYLEYAVECYNRDTSESSNTAVSTNFSPLSSSRNPERKPHVYYECEMCSAVFTDRAQLLLHVPIHI